MPASLPRQMHMPQCNHNYELRAEEVHQNDDCVHLQLQLCQRLEGCLLVLVGNFAARIRGLEKQALFSAFPGLCCLNDVPTK